MGGSPADGSLAGGRPAVRFVPLETCGDEEVVDLLQRGLGQGSVPRSTEFWEWKHRLSPFGASPGIAVRSGGRLVGLRVMLRWSFVAQGEHLPGARPVDTVVDPAFRRLGLFRAMTLRLLERLAAEDDPLVFNTPNRTSLRGYLGMGWQVVGRIPVLLRPRRPLRLVRAALGGRRGAPAVPAAARGAGVPVAQALMRPGLAELVAATWQGEPRLATARSPEYLEWRYARAAGLSYRALSVGDGGGTADAVAVFRSLSRRGLHEVRIVELLARSGAEAAVRRLLRELGRQADADYLVACAMPGTRDRRWYRTAGFLPAPVGPPMVVRLPQQRSLLPPAGGGADPGRWAGWRLTSGDLEVF